MKTYLTGNLEPRTGPGKRSCPFCVAGPALMNSNVRLQGHCFFSFWKSQPQATLAFRTDSAISLLPLAISLAGKGALTCLIYYQKGSEHR